MPRGVGHIAARQCSRGMCRAVHAPFSAPCRGGYLLLLLTDDMAPRKNRQWTLVLKLHLCGCDGGSGFASAAWDGENKASQALRGIQLLPHGSSAATRERWRVTLQKRSDCTKHAMVPCLPPCTLWSPSQLGGEREQPQRCAMCDGHIHRHPATACKNQTTNDSHGAVHRPSHTGTLRA